MNEVIFVNENKYYIDMGGIRLIVEDNVVTGWYEPQLDRVV